MSNDMVPIHMRDTFWKDPFFSSTWEEFDKMRQEMMSRSKEFWSRVDKDQVSFDDAVKKAHSEMDMQMTPFRPQLPTWAIPNDLRNTWAPFTTKGDDVIKVVEDDKKLEVTLDVSEYKPEELKVTTINNVLSIEGKHESNKTDDQNTPNVVSHNSSSAMRQFSRKWTLPQDANPNDVVSNLSSDGVLIVTAPRKPAALTTDVPIRSIK